MLDMKQEISTEIKQELVKQALAARKFAYVPYSKFRVGAAVLAKNGAIYTGCNIENAAYTPTNCAERTAFFKAVSEGERSFTAIAVVGGPEGASEFDWCAPCGVCRQVMKEFCHEDAFQIILARSVKEYKVYTLAELLPMGFGPDNLQ
jgi:cytidine deaminase